MGDFEREGVAHERLLAAEFGEEFGFPDGLFRKGGEVFEFVRIGLEIEELSYIHLRVLDEFPPSITNSPLDVAVTSQDAGADGRGSSCQDAGKAEAFGAGRRLHTGKFAEGGIHVDEITEGITALAGGNVARWVVLRP